MYQKGMSLVEVMVAVAILASGLLGLGALQARSLQFNFSSHNRGIAADLATDLAERIRASRSPFIASSDADPLPPMPPDFSLCVPDGAGGMTCATQSTTLPKYRETYMLDNANAENEMKTWYATLTSQIPGATFTLVSDEGVSYPYPIKYTLTITWPDNRGNTVTGDPADSSYVAVIE